MKKAAESSDPTALSDPSLRPGQALLRRRRLFERRPDRRDNWVIRIPDPGEHDPVMDWIHLEHLELERLAFLHRIARVLDVGDAQLGYRDEPLDVVAEIDDDALIHQPH